MTRRALARSRPIGTLDATADLPVRPSGIHTPKARCACCGAEASYGETVNDMADTGPWLCGPVSFHTRPGCRMALPWPYSPARSS